MAHAQAGSFVLSFSLSLMGQEPGQESGEFSGQGFSRIRMSSPSMPFEGVVPSDGSAAPGHLYLQLVLASPTWFCCCSGPGAELQLRPRRYLQGGDLLYLAVNRSALVFTYLSQFPYSTCQGIFLASYYPVSTPHNLKPKLYKVIYKLTMSNTL